MLKFFFWTLLLANAGLFAYQHGYLEAWLPTGREPARMSTQLNADKIRLMPPPTAATASPTPSVASAPAPAATGVENVAQKPAQNAQNATQNAEFAACTEIGNFNRQEAAQFEAKLAALALGTKVTKRPVREVATHIVYIPPLPDLEAAEKKAGELRRLGVTDYYIIQDNSNLRMGISLGVFKQEEAARDQLAKLNQKGVRSARIGERTVSTNMIAFQLRDLDASARDSVDKLLATFPKREVRRCES
jgi:hypothetical protein